MMKRYIIAALALIGLAGNAVAQRDITSQYITNATLSNGTNGWTKTFTKNTQTNDPADAFSNSVRGNNTVGYASEAYAGWGSLIQTAYSMKQTITLPAGNYRLVNYSFFRQGEAYNTNSSKSLAYLKAGNNQVALKTLGSIQAAGYANSQAEGANCFDSKMYRNTLEFTIADDNTPIEIGVEGTFDEMRSWCIVGMFELFDLDDVASVSSPTDVTYAITNPGFEYRDLTGWTNNGFNCITDNDNIGGKAGRAYIEYYKWDGLENGKNISQKLTGLDNGLYEVTVYGHQQQGTPNDGVKLYANDDYTFIGSTTQDYSVRTTVSNNELTIKIQTEGSTANWTAFDKFRLKFFGDPLQAYKDLLAERVAEAQALVDGGTLRTGAANQLQGVIDANDNDDDAFTTEDQFNTAVSNIEAGMTLANAIAATYADYDAYRAQFEALKSGVSSCQSLTTFESAISAANTAVANATNVDVAATQKAAVRAAAMTFIKNTDDHQFDITFLASQNYSDWKKKDDSNAGIVADQFLTNRPASIPSFAESYETTCETTGTVLYQTVSDLPAGYYQVGMYAAAMFTSGRGFSTEATEGDANRTYAFAGDLNDANSILRTGAPISFNTVRDFNDLTTLDVNVHLSSDGNLTFGVQKDANGSNWHFAQIMSIIYSNQPDLSQLKATRDALVSEATGLKNGADAEYLTSAQKSALQDAIDAGNAADDFDELNTVTLTTLPNAINNAKQQIQQVKSNRVQMIAALERFENDYNLADGTDYRRLTMSAKAWTDLLDAVDDVTEALDDVSQASNYGTLKDALVSQMDATDTSLRLFKSYKAMVEGCQDLSITEGTTYAANSYMDTDATEQTAIGALNTAFGTYAGDQSADFSAAAFLGSNLDFNAAHGTMIVGNGDGISVGGNYGIFDIEGWEEVYQDYYQNYYIQTANNSFQNQLYIRSNWEGTHPSLAVKKERMLPIGKYSLSFKWNSDMANMNNLSAYVVDNTSTSIGKATTDYETLTYNFEVTDSPKPFDILFGFKRTSDGNNPAQIVVDDITLKYLKPTVSLANNADNSTTIAERAGLTFDVTLADRTLYKDGAWNTICLPFNMDADQVTALLGANGTLMELDTEENANYEHKTGIDGTKLYLNFKDATTITEGKPYLIKWTNGDNLNTPTFDNVTIVNGTPDGIESEDQQVIFQGTYGPVRLTNDGTNLYLSSNNDLKWPSSATYTIKAFRAYFIVPSTTTARQFVLNFGNDETTGIANVNHNDNDNRYFNLNGQRVDKPVKTGLYISKGKKVIIK